MAGLRRPEGAAKPERETEPVEETPVDEPTATAPVVEPEVAPAAPEVEAPVEVEHTDEADESDEPAVEDEAAEDGGLVAEDVDDEEEEDEEPAKARPSGKRRSTGLRAPTAEDDLAKAERRSRDDKRRPAKAVRVRKPESPARSRMNLAIVLVVAALLCGGLALWFRGEANSNLDAADTGNIALTDVGATSQLIGELRPPIEAIFSVDYRDLDKASKAANANLTGEALKQYNQMFGVVRDNAAKQKLVSTFKIRNIAVMSLHGDSAEALVFADLSRNRPCYEDKANKVSLNTCGAAIGVPAQRVDGHWKITGFDMFNLPPVG